MKVLGIFMLSLFHIKKNYMNDYKKFEMTEKELLTLQPKNVTFGESDITPIQEDILTLISDALQKYMTNGTELPKDLFYESYVEIKCDEAGGENNKDEVINKVQC